MASSDLRMGLLDLLRLTRAGEQELVAGLSLQERAAVGTPEDWGAKDVIAHVTAWRLRTVERVRAALEDTEPPPLGTDDEENADTFATYSERSWHEVEDDADRSIAALADLLPAFSDADLTNGQRYAWNGGRPLILSILGNGVEHPVLHLGEYNRQHGQSGRALQLRERLVAAARGAHLSDQLLGNLIYNLACAYALNGDVDRAIATLQEVVRLHPALTTLAREDADFAAIRVLPAFQAIVGG